VFLCVSLPSLLANRSVKCIPHNFARQRLGKRVHAAPNTRRNRGVVGRVVFFTIRVVSNESLWVCAYLPIVARKRPGKHIPTATKNCWRRYFLCGPCHIKRKYAISSSQN
jgi:hypothetical protein